MKSGWYLLIAGCCWLLCAPGCFCVNYASAGCHLLRLAAD